MSALRAFLGELVDDAGLFPPAQLSMRDALAAHERAESGEAYWMLGRFIVPASRVAELVDALDDSPDALPLGVTLDGRDVGLEFADAARREDERGDRIAIEALECKIGAGSQAPAAHIAGIVDAFERAGFAGRPSLYIEVPPRESELEAAFASLRRERDERGFDICAKLRCGGPKPEDVPAPRAVAHFIAAAQASGVPFKATAGLHHPLRGRHGADGAVQHGFLNVIGAAVLASSGELDEAELERIVADEAAGDFVLDGLRFAWREREVDAEGIGRARARLVRSYGSCSIDEPVAGLRALGLLAAS